MTTALAERTTGAAIMERVLIEGDLDRLQPEERVTYYQRVCESLGLNPLTKPFEYIKLNGKLTLYARKDCADQLRKLQSVSVTKLERERLDDLYVVTAYATDKSGRSDSAVGAVNVKGLAGENLANALMKAETKAKRRVTLSLCGLGWTDESEVDSIPSAQTIVVDHATGEVLEERPALQQPKPQKMIDHPNNSKYQNYANLCERAIEFNVPYEQVELPISEARLAEMYSELAAAIRLAKQEATV